MDYDAKIIRVHIRICIRIRIRIRVRFHTQIHIRIRIQGAQKCKRKNTLKSQMLIFWLTFICWNAYQLIYSDSTK